MKLITIPFLISASAACNAQQFTDLGALAGAQESIALDISGDGTVAVGRTLGSFFTVRALRWNSNGMSELGLLVNATAARARATSFDGSVVVGHCDTSDRGPRAFRWTAADGMTDLGTLTGGNNSYGRAVSDDGLVIVGYGGSSNGTRAFRWTSAAGMTDLGTIIGGTTSFGLGVSADGSVIAGYCATSNGDRAFRWTSAGMTNLGTLAGGTESEARAASADGSIVVGNSIVNGLSRAFRWTSAGMTDIGTLAGGLDAEATGVSADGMVISGRSGSTNGSRAFIYSHREMLDVQDWLGSVGGVHSILSTSLELTRTFTEGAHHRPLAELGRGKSYWVTGDVASSSRSRDLNTRSGEAGATFEPWTNVLVGVGAGYGRQDHQLLNGGSASTSGQYLVGEVDLLLADGGVLSVLISSGDWQNETDRGYVTGTGVDSSHGETNLASKAVRLRYDSPVLTRVYATDLKAYVSYTHSKVRSDAYAETGGSFAGSFGAMEQTAKEGRLGFAATHAFGEKTKVRLSAEWIRRFDHDQAALTATDITSTLDLTLPTADPIRDQARVGVDVDYALDNQTTLSFTVHASGVGESADVSGAISLRRAF